MSADAWDEGVRMEQAAEAARDAAEESMWDHEAIHLWFGLTYANYLVVPRSVLQSMPDEWQARFVGCLREMDEAFGHLDWPSYDVRTLRRPPEFIYPRVKCEDCEGTGRDTEREDEECDWCDGLGERDDDDSPRYETPEEVGFRTDPIPHYNRGRTRLEARSGA
jgi:hypothetical protein